MHRSSKKPVVSVAIIIGVLVLVAAGIALRRPILERWYLARLESGSEVDGQAVAWLASADPRRVVPRLVDAARRSVDGLPSDISELFDTIEWEPRDPNVRIPGTGRGAYPVFPAASQALIQVGEPAATPLADLLGEESDTLKFFGFYALLKIGPASVSAISALLRDDPSDGVRALAAECLEIVAEVHGGEPSKSAVPFLQAALSDATTGVRANAAQALGKYGPYGTPAVLDLVALAQEDDDATARFYAVRSLGRIGPTAEAAIPALEEMAVRDDDEDLKAAVAEALLKIRGGTPQSRR